MKYDPIRFQASVRRGDIKDCPDRCISRSLNPRSVNPRSVNPLIAVSNAARQLRLTT
ncbi:MAG: hypothetical protein VYA84_12015 [Planctomycetota bacterium]|nr:hypothetical protein [Planctomycetota bacterium]